MRLADGVLLVVDAAEGTMVVTEKVVKQALAEGLPITLLLTKARSMPHPIEGFWGPSHSGLQDSLRAQQVFFFLFAPNIL